MVILDLEYFQDVQNVYSTLTNLNVSITDKEGDQIIPLSHTSIFYLLYDQENLKTVFGKIIQNLPKINEPVLYDALPGIKMIICPIYLEEDIEFFIFAGCFLEYSSKHSVQLYLKRTLNSLKKVNCIFSLIQEDTLDEIQDKTKKINKMSEMLSNQLLTQKLKENLEVQNKNKGEIFQLLADDNLRIYDLLERFKNNNSKVDFVGYARRISLVQFEIQECIPSDNQLKGTVFFIGEGILGQVAAIKTEKFWDNMNWDPRNLFFHKKGIFPKSIFCFPINQDQDILGLFFGGSSELENLEEKVSLEAKLTTSSIRIIENKMYWYGKAMFNHLKNTVTNDIFQFMTSLQDIKSVQTFLLDMSISLTHTSFVSVVLLQKSKNSIDMVSRGLTEEKINEYINDIADRYIKNKDIQQQTIAETIKCLTKWDTKVLEIPIVHLNDLYGYLYIGLSDDIKDDELSLYKMLANAGGVAFHVLKIFNKVEIQQTMIEPLFELLKYNNPEQFKNATKAREIIMGFGSYLSDPKIDITALKYSCYFIGYDEPSLKEKKVEKDNAIIDILSEYLLVTNNALTISDVSINVQILILVWTYINEEQNINSLSEINGINNDLLNNFIFYLSRSDTKPSEVSINDAGVTVNETLINKNLNLTKRETEVLELVLTGKSNREIGENLYISGHTVKNHMTKIFHKLSVNDRTQAIAKIYQMGFHPRNVF